MRPSGRTSLRRATLALVCAAGAIAPATAAASGPAFSVHTLAVPGVPGSLGAADFDGDGTTDLVYTAGSPGPVAQTPVVVALNDGTGAFPPIAERFPTTSAAGIFGGAVGDFDRDGRPDLVGTSATPDPTVTPPVRVALAVLAGTGDGRFTPLDVPLTAPAGSDPPEVPRPVVPIDVNRDGRLDLAGILGGVVGPSSLAVFVHDADGTLAARPPVALPEGTVSPPVAADFDGDGRTDLAMAIEAPRTTPCPPECSGTPAGSIHVLRGDGGGGFAPLGSTPVGAPSGLLAADFDRDGRTDVAAIGPFSSAVTVLRGAGDGRFAPMSSPVVGPYEWALAAADLDGNGTLDLAVASGTYDGLVTVLLGDGHGQFTPGTPTHVQGDVPEQIVAADLDGDGRQDLVTADTGTRTVSVLLNRGVSAGDEGGGTSGGGTGGGGNGVPSAAARIVTPHHHDAGRQRVTRAGRFRLRGTRVTCAHSGAACLMRVRATTTVLVGKPQAHSARRRTMVLATARRALAPGVTRAVALRLSARGRRTLRRVHRARTKVRITVTKPGAATAHTTVRVTLLAARRR